MKNFKFIISYDGSRYFGWERQPGRDTIQGKLEAVLTRMCGADVQVIGAGRTDAGVHAKAMAANAYMDTEKTPEEIRDYMNRYLPDDICVQEAKLAADRFLQALYAVNDCYFPSRKRTERAIAGFSLKPENCYARLLNLVALAANEATIDAAVTELRALAAELTALGAVRALQRRDRLVSVGFLLFHADSSQYFVL